MKKSSLLLATSLLVGGYIAARPSQSLALEPNVKAPNFKAPGNRMPDAETPDGETLDGETPVQLADLDPNAFAQWVDGTQKPLDPIMVRRALQPVAVQSVIETDKTRVGNSGVTFGDSTTLGPRHLRIGFTRPIAVGSVLTHGGGTLSVLKANAPYPGDLNRESDWLPAQRLVGGQVTNDEVARTDYGLWSLPPGTRTRALRFSHRASGADQSYAGFLGGALILSERAQNSAPLAQAGASADDQDANRINNQQEDKWQGWTNLQWRNPEESAAISPRNPVSVTLTWPNPVKLSGLQLLWTGFSAATIQSYDGPADRNPRDSADRDWRDVATVSDLKSGYPSQLWSNRIDFGKTIVTRAVRLQITAPNDESTPRVQSRVLDGRRVWLGEIIALSPLGDAPLDNVPSNNAPSNNAPSNNTPLNNAPSQSSVLTAATSSAHPPIPVRFHLDRPGVVTLVIEKPDGTRVRNLVSETPFPAGDNTAWWDGTDDLGRDVDAAQHGVYRIPAQFVAPGTYRVRGLVHDPISTHYEFSIYSPGNPPWETADKTGGWTTNHTPAQAALWVPANRAPGGKPLIYLGSYVAEGGAGLAWVDQNGVKQGGQKWVGGNWTGAPYLSADNGPNALPGVFAYAASVWKTGKGSKQVELRVTALSDKSENEIVRTAFDPRDIGYPEAEISGLAVRDGLIAVALPIQRKILFARAQPNAKGKIGGQIVASVPMDDVRALFFDDAGRLLMLVGRELRRYPVSPDGVLGAPTTIISQGLQDPNGLMVDGRGDIYVADWGQSHQVKVFSAGGQLLKTVGRAGAPQAGPYDELHMNHPLGMALDGNGRLWVAENDFLPKRVSVWNADGTLWKAFYGPGKYGGGGTLDSNDPTRFLYSQPDQGTLEFKLDWQTGNSRLVNVLVRKQAGDMELPFRAATPELPLLVQGRRYLTNGFNSNPVSGHGTALIYLENNGVAQPVAALGFASQWDVLQSAAFKANWPAGSKDALFVWTDSNGDGHAQPNEVRYRAATSGAGVTVMPDLSFAVARVDDVAMRFAPTGFNQAGVPQYNLASGEKLASGVSPAASSGGSQVLTTGAQNWSVITLGAQSLPAQSISGTKTGAAGDVAAWSYPSLWPGLHASHTAPQPDRPGELQGTTRILGEFFNPRGSTAGPLWALNSNMGTVYLFTADGLFVQTLFQDFRQGQPWAMPRAVRGTDLDGVSLGNENFWPTITQTPDGQVYLNSGRNISLIRLDGLDTLRRLPDSQIQVGAAELQAAQSHLTNQEATRQNSVGNSVLQIAVNGAAPRVDGQLDDWANAKWVDIDKSGVAAFFNAKTRPYDITGALAVSGDRLFAAYRTGNAKLLQNSGEVPTALFKTGGALDLMLGTDPNANPQRTTPVAGDLRLIVTQNKGRTIAVLYRAVVPGARNPVPFSSPVSTVSFDEVRDVSAQVQLAGSDGNYEFSIPLSVLGLNPRVGETLSGDIGILRGDGFETTSRTYWSNKATSIVADLPSEAQLTPQLWGKLEFVAR